MAIKFHNHAEIRMKERGATKKEVIETVEKGERTHTKHGRTRFRRNFVYNDIWQGKSYASKQVEAIAVKRDDDWLVLTVVTRFF
jgi:hypothetical protein